MDLISQEGDRISIPASWVNQWHLLSDYYEDMGSDTLHLPLFTTQQIEEWFYMNAEMYIIQLQDKILPSYSKSNATGTYNLIRFLNPCDGSWLLRMDISVFPQEERMKLYKELGHWLRRQEKTVRDFDLIRISDDPAVTLTSLIGNTSDSVLEHLRELAYAIPLDILYGIYFSSSIRLEAKNVIDWKTLPWEDLAIVLESHKEEWLSTATTFVKQCAEYAQSHPLIDMNVLSNIQPMGYLSNIVCFFTKRPLLSTGWVDDMVILPSHTEAEIRDYLDRKALCKLSRRSGVRLSYITVLNRHIPHLPDLVDLVCDYAEKYPDWRTADVLFCFSHLFSVRGIRRFRHNTIGTVGSILGELLNDSKPDRSPYMGNASPSVDMPLFVQKIRDVLGDRCLRTIFSLISTLKVTTHYSEQFVEAVID